MKVSKKKKGSLLLSMSRGKCNLAGKNFSNNFYKYKKDHNHFLYYFFILSNIPAFTMFYHITILKNLRLNLNSKMPASKWYQILISKFFTRDSYYVYNYLLSNSNKLLAVQRTNMQQKSSIICCHNIVTNIKQSLPYLKSTAEDSKNEVRCVITL